MPALQAVEPAPEPALLMIEPAPGTPHVGSRMLDRQARDAERHGAHELVRPDAAATRLQAAFRAHRARAWLRERRGAVRTIQRLRQQLAARRRGVRPRRSAACRWRSRRR